MTSTCADCMQQVPWMISAALARRALLGRSWDQVAAAAGRILLTDDIHLSEAATVPLIELVAGWLTGCQPTRRRLPQVCEAKM